VFREKHPLTFSVISLWKVLRFAQNFQEIKLGNNYSENGKVIYFLLPVTSCWCHIFMFINYGFYRWRQTF